MRASASGVGAVGEAERRRRRARPGTGWPRRSTGPGRGGRSRSRGPRRPGRGRRRRRAWSPAGRRRRAATSASQASTRGMRAFSEFTFQVAKRIASTLPAEAPAVSRRRGSTAFLRDRVALGRRGRRSRCRRRRRACTVPRRRGCRGLAGPRGLLGRPARCPARRKPPAVDRRGRLLARALAAFLAGGGSVDRRRPPPRRRHGRLDRRSARAAGRLLGRRLLGAGRRAPAWPRRAGVGGRLGRLLPRPARPASAGPPAGRARAAGDLGVLGAGRRLGRPCAALAASWPPSWPAPARARLELDLERLERRARRCRCPAGDGLKLTTTNGWRSPMPDDVAGAAGGRVGQVAQRQVAAHAADRGVGAVRRVRLDLGLHQRSRPGGARRTPGTAAGR